MATNSVASITIIGQDGYAVLLRSLVTADRKVSLLLQAVFLPRYCTPSLCRNCACRADVVLRRTPVQYRLGLLQHCYNSPQYNGTTFCSPCARLGCSCLWRLHATLLCALLMPCCADDSDVILHRQQRSGILHDAFLWRADPSSVCRHCVHRAGSLLCGVLALRDGRNRVVRPLPRHRTLVTATLFFAVCPSAACTALAAAARLPVPMECIHFASLLSFCFRRVLCMAGMTGAATSLRLPSCSASPWVSLVWVVSGPGRPRVPESVCALCSLPPAAVCVYPPRIAACALCSDWAGARVRVMRHAGGRHHRGCV